MAALILLALVATANALVIDKRAVPGPEVNQPVALEAGLSCSDKTDDLSWGVFMDGRDAGKGKYAYGKSYATSVNRTLRNVYRMVPSQDTSGLKLKSFMKIVKLLGKELRGEHLNGAMTAVKSCHKSSLPEDLRASILKDVVVLDEDYHPKSSDMSSALTKLFKTYNGKIEAATEPEQKIIAMSWLLQNMAFIHPLPGSNGRSRTMLLQHELRRTGIACGTMMYNNNKDIYFETKETYAKKLHEGIEMYDQAYKSGANPWEAKTLREEHMVKFVGENDSKLKKCWDRFCPPGKDGAKGCEGTSPALKVHSNVTEK